MDSKQEKFFKFYNQSSVYFELAEKGHCQENIFPIHRQILNKCRDKKGLIVDLGCGTGLDAMAMLGDNNRCLGLDISGIAVKKATARTEELKIKNIDFKQADLSCLPLTDNSVDIITSFYTFEHLLDPEKVLSEIDRVLKPEGEAFLLCPNFSSPFRGAPVFGGIRKIRIFKKMFLSLGRFFGIYFLMDKSFKIKMIDSSLIDLPTGLAGQPTELASEFKIGYDWDAANEPSLLEFVNYFKRRKYKILSESWLTPPKTQIENFFANFKKLPIIKYWGPVCYVYAQKR